jgi:hypothetical protein
MKRNDNRHFEEEGVSRREFGRRAAFGVVAGAIAASALSTSATAVVPSALPPHMSQEQARSGLSVAAQAEVEAKLQHVLTAYSDRLSDDQKKRMRQIITGHVRMLEAVRPIPTANGDAPATVLKLVRGREEFGPVRID